MATDLFFQGHDVGIFRMLLEVIDDKSAARHDLEVVGTDLLKRALHQLRSDAAATQRGGVSVWVIMTLPGASR